MLPRGTENTVVIEPGTQAGDDEVVDFPRVLGHTEYPESIRLSI